MNLENIRKVQLNDFIKISKITESCWLSTYVIEDFKSENGNSYSVSHSDISTLFEQPRDDSKLPEFVKNLNSNPDKNYLVASNDEDEVVGFSLGYMLSESKKDQDWLNLYISSDIDLDKSLYIKTLYINPEFQGKGIGGSLLDKQIKFAFDRKAINIFIAVTEYNTKAIEIYKHKGFKIVSKPFDLVFETERVKIKKPVLIMCLSNNFISKL